MPEPATLPSSPPASAAVTRDAAAVSGARPGDAADKSAYQRGAMVHPRAGGFTAAFASALQDIGRDTAPMSGDQPALTVLALSKGLASPVEAVALTPAGQINASPAVKRPGEPATSDPSRPPGTTAPREGRPKHLTPAVVHPAVRPSDTPVPDAVTVSVGLAPSPLHPVSKPALHDAEGITAGHVSKDPGAAPAPAEGLLSGATPTQAAGEQTIAAPATAAAVFAIVDRPATTPAPNQPNALAGLDVAAVQSLALAGSGSPASNLVASAPVTSTRLQTPEPTVLTVSPADQVAPAIIRLSSADGVRRISLQLAPTDLGLVDIQIAQPKEGPVTITLTVQHARTFDLLQNDLAQLALTFDRAGLNSEGRQVSLHLAPVHTPSSPTDSVSPASPPASGGIQGQGAGQDMGSGMDPGPHSHTHPDTGQRPRPRGADFAAGGGHSEISGQAETFTTYRADYRAGLNITA